jgi:hypothetical protein
VPGFSQAQLDRLTADMLARINRDPLRRSLDISPSAGALRRNAAGVRQVPSWMTAGRTSSLGRKPGDPR